MNRLTKNNYVDDYMSKSIEALKRISAIIESTGQNLTDSAILFKEAVSTITKDLEELEKLKNRIDIDYQEVKIKNDEEGTKK